MIIVISFSDLLCCLSFFTYLWTLNSQADEVIKEMERKSDEQLAKFKEESRQQLIRVMEEHAAMVITRLIQI